MPVVEGSVELVDPDARGTQIGIVASHAILREERLRNLVERRLERALGDARRLAKKETRRERYPERGKQSEGEHGLQSKPTIP
jgi:hypothetical protein